MAVYAYKGRNKSGELVQGNLEGGDAGEVADQLFKTGITPIEINPSRKLRPGSGSISSRKSWFRRLNQPAVNQLDVMLFSRQMYTLLKAGVPIMRALAGLQESARKPAMAALMQDLRESLDSGRELSAAMYRHPAVFSAFYVSMIHVGEMTGKLEDTFIRLYTHLEFEKQMRENIRSALRYPAFVAIAITVAIVVVNIFVIPAFVKVFEGFHATLPLMTRLLIGSSNFFVHYWPLLLALAIGAAAAFRSFLHTAEGRYQWDKYKLRIPIAGKIILKSTQARFARSLALAMSSGIPILQGLNAVSLVVDNAFMRARVEQMRDGVGRGESILRTAIAADVFDAVVLQMIAVGEETGDLDSLMFEVAGMYEQEVEYEVKSLGAQIEPIMIVALGVMVLILALGIFLPMWDLGRAALHK